MKKIGMIGGLTFSSSSHSYRMIAEKANAHMKGYQTAEILILSLNPEEAFSAMHQNNWAKVTDILVAAANQLERMGADFIMIPCNTIHKVAKDIQARITIPFISMLDCVGSYIKKIEYTTVGLLGTQFTMEEGFYSHHLRQHFNVKTQVPPKSDREILHQIIFDELCKGIFSQEAKRYVKTLCNNLHHFQGCDAVILGCTELPLLLKQNETQINLIDTIDVQADFVVDFAKNNIIPLHQNISGI